MSKNKSNNMTAEENKENIKKENLNLSFSEKIKAVVRKIPRGEVLTYKEVATLAGNPKAARAVAMVMSKNYDPTVPCHRVIRTDGGLGGYNRGGIERKREILEEEGYLNAEKGEK